MFIASSILLMMACEVAGEPHDVWSQKKGKLTVWDDTHGVYYCDNTINGAEIGFPNIFLNNSYIHSAPGWGPENKSPWVQKNGELIDKMEQQWRESAYYNKDAPCTLEFSRLEDLSIISYYDLWGRKSGEELVDMFLIKPCGPFFNFPEGDMLPYEEYDKWMTLEEWKSKACACSLFYFKVKEPIDSENLIMIFTTTVRDSWNSSHNIRKAGVLVGKRDGLYSGSVIVSDEERERITEWFEANGA